MRQVKLISNRDGESGGRGTTFAEARPCTYRVEIDGQEVGTMQIEHAYPLASIHPAWSGHAACWVARSNIDGHVMAASQLQRKALALLKRA